MTSDNAHVHITKAVVDGAKTVNFKRRGHITILRLKNEKPNCDFLAIEKGIPTHKVSVLGILYAKGIRVQSLIGRLPISVTEG